MSTSVSAASLLATTLWMMPLHAEALPVAASAPPATAPPSSPDTFSGEERTLARDPLQKAKDAKEAGIEAQRARNIEGAARAARLAAQWESVAAELVRAIRAENRASELQTESLELKQKIARARALLEETLARRGRAKTALEQLRSAPETEKKP